MQPAYNCMQAACDGKMQAACIPSGTPWLQVNKNDMPFTQKQTTMNVCIVTLA